MIAARLTQNHTFASGAKQLVVHDALDTTWSLSGLYFSSFTPITNIGAEEESTRLSNM